MAPTVTPLADRFWAKVEKLGPDDCWQWTGVRQSNGYGGIGSGGKYGKRLMTHRVSYELANGPISGGLVIDHLCRNRGCVNPAHLEVVTTRENLLRGTGASARNAKKTSCVNGHDFTPTSTRINSRGDRVCKTCDAERTRSYKARKRAAS